VADYASPRLPSYPQGECFDPDSNEIYVGDYGGNDVVIFNATTGAGVGVIPVHAPPNWYGETVGMAFDPIHHHMFIAATVTDVVLVIDSYTNREVSSPIPTGSGPVSLSIDASRNELFSANAASGNVTVINTSSLRVQTAGIQIGGSPDAVQAIPSIGMVYVADSQRSQLDVIDEDFSNLSLPRISLVNNSAGSYAQPRALALDTANSRLFVASYYGATAYSAGNISVLNPATRRFVTPGFLISGAQDATPSLMYDTSNHFIYAGFLGVGVVVINGTSLTSVNPGIRSTTSPTGLATDPSTGLIYIVDGGKVNVSVFDPISGRIVDPNIWLAYSFDALDFDSWNGIVFALAPSPVNPCAGPGRVIALRPGDPLSYISEISVGYGPVAITDDGAGGHVFVADACSRDVVVLSSANYTVVQTVKLAQVPSAVAFDVNHSQLFVSEPSSFNITVINTLSWGVSTVPLYNHSYPGALAYDSADQRLFVVDQGGWNISIIDAGTLALSSLSPPVGRYPAGILYDNRTGQILVANSGSGNLTLLNASNPFSPPVSISVTGSPEMMLRDPSSEAIYVVDAYADNLTLVSDKGAKAFSTSVRVDSRPTGIAFVTGLNQLYISTYTGVVGVVSSPPLIQLITSPTSVDVGQLAVISTLYLSRGSFVTFNYTGLPSGCLSANMSQLLCTPLAAGFSNVSVSVRDRWGENKSSVEFVVAPPLANVSVSFFPARIALGQWTILTVNWSGGRMPTSMTFEGLPPGCDGPSVPASNCTPTSSGTFLVTAFVRDSNGIVVASEAVLEVLTALRVDSLTASNASLKVGSPLLLQVSFTGGGAPYAFRYSGLPIGCANSSSPFILCFPESPGNYNVSVSVRDGLGETSGGSTLVRVLLPLAPRVLAFVANPNPAVVSAQVTFQASIVSPPGASPTFSYNGLPPGCGSINVSILVCTPSTVGSFSVSISVEDSWGQVTSASIQNLIVNPEPSQSSSQNQGSLTFLVAILVVGSLGFGLSALALAIIYVKRSDRLPEGEPKSDFHRAR
jgi:DNA-binding beta-propeller fold protein YncE